MALRPPYSLDGRSNSLRFAIANQTVRAFGALDILVPSNPVATDEPAVGRPAVLPQYTPEILLTVIVYLGLGGEKFTWPRVVEVLTVDLDESCLRVAGAEGFAAPKFRRRFHRSPSVSSPAEKIYKAWVSEVERCRAAASACFAPIDSTPLPANVRHRVEKIHAAWTDEHEQRDILLNEVCNRLIAGHLLTIAKRAGHDVATVPDALTALMPTYKGDVGVDDTTLRDVLYGNSKRGYAGGKQKSRSAAKIREGEGKGLGHTAVVVVSRPGSPELPVLALAIASHEPNSGAKEGAYRALATMDRIGIRNEPVGRAHQYLVVDKAYPNYRGFVEWLLPRKWSLVGKYLKTPASRPFYDLADRTGDVSGPYLFRGAIHCPGVPRDMMRAHPDLDFPATREKVNDKGDTKEVEPMVLKARFDEHERLVRKFEPSIMPTNGRARPRMNVAGGRPPKSADRAIEYYSLKVGCPARDGKVICDRLPESEYFKRRSGEGLPQIISPPPPGEPAPECCTSAKGEMTIRLTPQQFGDYQTHMVGTDAHESIYLRGRSATERHFSSLRSKHGGDWQRGRIQWKSNALDALAMTAITIKTNHELLDVLLRGDHGVTWFEFEEEEEDSSPSSEQEHIEKMALTE